MSQVRCFTLVGDSNVRRYVNKASCRANPAMASAQILICGSFEIFKETLIKARPESNACIVSCLTNFLASADGPDSISQRIDPVLQDIREVLLELCEARPEMQYLLSPPMYRTSPTWFREGLPEVLTSFSQVLSPDRPPNLHILSSFATPSFGSDGVHLTPYSGLEFLMHLFDGALELLAGLEHPVDVVVAKTSEGTRVLEDRVMALEQDHKRLNLVVEKKIAVDAEAADFRENASYLDSFVIAGLPLIPPDLVGKEWQDRAVSDVQEVIRKLMGRPMPIIFVSNSTARHKDAEVKYTVKMKEISDSHAIRTKFGSFFIGGKSDQKPPELKPYSIRNRVTPETQVRIAILQVLGRRYRTSNPGSKVKVIGYDPRPKMKITPAPDSSDRRVKNYHFIEAVRAFPTNFVQSELDFIFKKINPKWCGNLRSLFICLSDDEYRRLKLTNRVKSTEADGEEVAEVDPAEAHPPDSGEPEIDVDARSEVSAMSVASIRSSRSSGKTGPEPSGSGKSQSRSHKRGATSTPDGAAPAKK